MIAYVSAAVFIGKVLEFRIGKWLDKKEAEMAKRRAV